MRYAEERHWDVFPGTWLEAVGGGERCSCGDAGCALPGATRTGRTGRARRPAAGAAARRMWSRQPRASVLLPTGRAFDALEVPEAAGFLALARMERMDLTLGPVTCTPDRRMLFFVLPGGAAKAAELVRSLGWNAEAIDLSDRGEGPLHRRPRPPGSAAGAPCSGPAVPPTPTAGCPMWTKADQPAGVRLRPGGGRRPGPTS